MAKISDLIELAVENRLAEFHTCLPGKIISFDAQEQKAVVQPLIKRRYYDDDVEIQPIISSVPVIFPSCSTGILSFPIKKDDLVLLLFCEQSLDAWLYGDGVTPIDPEDHRRFHYSDAIAIPGLNPFSRAQGGNNTDVVLRYNIGTANENSVVLKEDGDIDITPKTKVRIVGALEVTQTIDATGDITSVGTITGETEVVAKTAGAAVHLSTHTTTGVTAGAGTSGPPTPGS